MGSGAATYEVGVTSTPVIDPAAGLLYVVDKTTGKHVLHALRLTTGQDAVTPAVVGLPTGFTSNIQLNRPGLLFLNGVVYIAFGSHCDAGSYHGWVFGHDAKPLDLKIAYTTTPSGTEGAIWQGGVGRKGGYVIVMNAADASSAVRSSAHWKTTSTSPCVDG